MIPPADTYQGDPSILDQLREAAERCERAAADQAAQARRYRAAIAALEGKPVPAAAPTPVPQPALPFPWPPPWMPQPIPGFPGLPVDPLGPWLVQGHGGNCACPKCCPPLICGNFTVTAAGPPIVAQGRTLYYGPAGFSVDNSIRFATAHPSLPGCGSALGLPH